MNDLFSEETRKERPEIAKDFDESWWNALSTFICTNERFDRLLIDLDEWRKEKTIYPNEEDVFRIFKLLPLDKVKVVIVGQDPYFNGNADGIAFSCKNDYSPSLKQMLFAMCKDINFPVNQLTKEKQGTTLDYLVEQGVFLYNPILTVEKDKPLSHEGLGWELFSREVIRTLIWRKEPPVFLLWGNKAKEFVMNIPPRMGDIPTTLIAEHPAAAARTNRTWTVNHFSETNKILKSLGKEEIKWLKPQT